MFFKFINELMNRNTEQQSLLDERAKALKEAQDRVEKLTEGRKIDQHNNEILLKKNNEMFNLLNDIADRTVQCPLGSEKIVLDKIRDLARPYQTKC